MKKILYTLVMGCGCVLASSVIAAESGGKKYYGKGYTIVNEEITRDDLSVSVYKKISARNVQIALNKLLAGTGWRLAHANAADPEINRLYQQPFPNHKNKIGPMPLDEALTLIAGDAWALVVDPVNKLVSFELSAKYSCFPSTKKVCPL